MMVPDPPRALALCDEVLAAAERAELVPIVADTLITRGSALAIAFRYYEGLGAIRTGTQLAEEHGLTATVMRGLVNQLGQFVDFDPRQAIEVGQTGLTLAGGSASEGSC